MREIENQRERGLTTGWETVRVGLGFPPGNRHRAGVRTTAPRTKAPPPRNSPSPSRRWGAVSRVTSRMFPNSPRTKAPPPDDPDGRTASWRLQGSASLRRRRQRLRVTSQVAPGGLRPQVSIGGPGHGIWAGGWDMAKDEGPIRVGRGPGTGGTATRWEARGRVA